MIWQQYILNAYIHVQGFHLHHFKLFCADQPKFLKSINFLDTKECYSQWTPTKGFSTRLLVHYNTQDRIKTRDIEGRRSVRMSVGKHIIQHWQCWHQYKENNTVDKRRYLHLAWCLWSEVHHLWVKRKEENKVFSSDQPTSSVHPNNGSMRGHPPFNALLSGWLSSCCARGFCVCLSSGRQAEREQAL